MKGLAPRDRQATIINKLTDALREVGGRYLLPFEFKSAHGERTSHYIVFVSKDFLGYHIMKEIMAGLGSSGADVSTFEYVPVRSPQLRLAFDQGLSGLKEVLLRNCAGQTMTVRAAYENHSVDTPYTLRNFKDAIMELEAEDKVAVDIPAAQRPKRNGVVTLADARTVTFPA